LTGKIAVGGDGKIYTTGRKRNNMERRAAKPIEWEEKENGCWECTRYPRITVNYWGWLS